MLDISVVTKAHRKHAVVALFKGYKLVIIGCLILIPTTVLIKNNEQHSHDRGQIFHAPVKLKKLIKPPKTRFIEQAELRGINFTHENGAIGNRMLPETMGAGAAFIDFDNDGDQDIVFANGTNWPWNEVIDSTQHIYENDGKGYFTDVTQQLGLGDSFYGTGIAVGDVNNDGFEDIFISALGNNHMYINHGGKYFIKSDEILDCTKYGWSSSAGFFDYDNDGDLDLMVLNYLQWSRVLDLSVVYKIDGTDRAYASPQNFPGTHNCLFENENGYFKDVTESSGIIVKSSNNLEFSGKSLSLLFIDINSDGWQDIVVANDWTRNFVYVNQQNKTFKEKSIELGLAYNANGKATRSTGLDSAYYKNDEDMGVVVGNLANEMTLFYIDRAHLGIFTDESIMTGIGPQSSAVLNFGLFFFDYDLDGRLDVFQTNGHVEKNIDKVQTSQQYKQRSQLFWNCGADCERTYIPVESAGDINRLDLSGRSAVYADIDNDGDLDVVVTQVAGKPKIFINESEKGNWLGIKLASNKSILDATISIYSANKIQRINYSPTKSYLGQVQNGKIVGLGNDKVDKIVLDYHGKKKLINNIIINQWNIISLE